MHHPRTRRGAQRRRYQPLAGRIRPAARIALVAVLMSWAAVIVALVVGPKEPAPVPPEAAAWRSLPCLRDGMNYGGNRRPADAWTRTCRDV